MAIDTEDKRRSAGCHPALSVLPVPNSDIDQGDRQQVAWMYRGIAAGVPSVATPGNTILVLEEDRTIRVYEDRTIAVLEEDRTIKVY